MIHILEDIEKFSSIFDAMPGCHALVQANSPYFTILAVTEGFLSNSGAVKEQLIGKGLFDLFPSNSGDPGDPGDTGQKNLLASFQYVISQRKPHEMPMQRYDVADENGNFTERYWVAKNKPVLDDHGQVSFIIHTAEEITKQVKARESEDLIKGMEHMENIFRQAPVAISILRGQNFIIELANEKMEEIYGKGKKILQRPIAEVLPELEAQGHIELLQNVISKGKLYYGYESPLTIVEDGIEKLKYYNFIYQPYYQGDKDVPAGVTVFVNDVTEKVNIKKDFLESEQRFQRMAESTEILIAVADETGNSTYFNKAWVELTGKPMEFFLQLGWIDLVHPDDQEAFMNIYSTSLKKQIGFSGEFRIMNKYGQYRWLLAKVPARFNADGSFAGYISSCIDITERKQAEQALLESEQRTRSLVESAAFPIGVYTGKEMKIELANQAMIKVWGKGNDVIGKKYFELLPELNNQEIYNQLQGVFETGVPFHAKNQRVYIVTDDQLQPYYFNYSFIPLFNTAGKIYGVMNTGADVTDLNLAKQKIEESEAQLRSLVMTAPVGICILKGNDFLVEVVNDSFLEVVGKSREAFVDSPYWEVLPEMANTHQPILENVLSKGIIYRGDDHEIKLMRNGKLQTLYVNFVYDPVKESDGTVTKIMIVIIEVTEQVIARQKIEEVINERTKELAEANKNLKKSNEELAQFAYIASHDLQEPLRKVSTFSQMLEQSLPHVDERSKSFLHKINVSTSRMTTLIRDVLAYSQLSKENELYESVNLSQLVDLIKSDFELLIEQKRAVIHVSGLPTIRAIPLQVSQLFSNLISNSLKFSSASVTPEITIVASLASADEVASHSLDTSLTYYNIEFRDNGIGFDQEHAKRIFNIFQRLHAVTDYSGTGIGLAMCKKIVQNHHGDIYATANKGSGAVFNVLLPQNYL